MSRRREHPPLPGKQQGIWRSNLVGMEQPVPSFTSFIRKTPPPTGSPSEKPLPPLPTWPPASPERSASVASWKAPAAWDEPTTPDQELQSSSAFSPRNYAPLLPDTSPGIFDSDEPAYWPFNVKDTQPRRLDSIHEQADRVSLSSALELSASSSSRSSSPKPQDEPANVPSDSNNRKIAVNTTKLYSTSSESSTSPTMSSVSPVTPSDGMFRTSNLSTKQKAFASLGIELPGGQRIMAEDWSQRAPETPSREGPRSGLSMHGKELQPVNKIGVNLDPNSSDPDISAKAQHLDAALDYHSVLAGVYHEEHAHDARSSGAKHKAKVPPSSRNAAGKQRELVPRPLSWKKDSNNSSPSSSLAKIDEDAKRVLDSRKRYRKMTNWVPFHQPIQVHKASGSKEEVAGPDHQFKAPSRKGTQVHETEIGHSKDTHERSHISQVKDFATHPKKGKGPANQATIRSITSSPSQPSLSSTPPSAEQQTRFLRLAGGFALVRQSPTSTPPSHSSSRLDISPPLPGPTSSYGQIPDIEIEPVSRRPSSPYSQQSEPPVAPGISVNKRNLRISPSPSSPKSRSNTSSPPTSPLAHEVSFPRTPPPPPHSSNLPPSRPPRGKASLDDERTDSGSEDKSHKKLLHIGIMDMARDARHAWKKHHQDAKHEKLKQSIRVLGPTDPGVTAAYVRRQGKGEGDENRMPGFLGGGPL